MNLKIGELARLATVSIRTLHHYDAIGLLSPDARTVSGARRYGTGALVRLHRILAMKQLGYSLADIKLALMEEGVDPQHLLRQHIDLMRARADQALAVSRGLQILLTQLSSGKNPSDVDWKDSLEMMALYQRHIDPQHLQAMMDTTSASDLDSRWANLIGEVRHSMKQGLAQDSPAAQSLGWRWLRLVIEKTGNSAAIERQLRQLQSSETRAQTLVGITPAMFDWIGQAMAHARTEKFAPYLSAEQTAVLRQRLVASMRKLDAWPHLVAQMQTHLEAGTSVAAEQVQDLAREWRDLFRETHCGEDAALESRIRLALANEPELRLGVGIHDSLIAYVNAAQAFSDTKGHHEHLIKHGSPDIRTAGISAISQGAAS